MASWQTCFAMPVRCDLLVQQSFAVSSSNGPQRSSLRKKRWMKCIALSYVGYLHVCESSPLILPHLASPCTELIHGTATRRPSTMSFSLVRAPIEARAGFSESPRYGDSIPLY